MCKFHGNIMLETQNLYFETFRGHFCYLMSMKENNTRFKEQWLSYGFTMVDFAASAILVWVHIISALIFMLLFRKSSKPISKICSVMTRQNQILGITEERLYKSRD